MKKIVSVTMLAMIILTTGIIYARTSTEETNGDYSKEVILQDELKRIQGSQFLDDEEKIERITKLFFMIRNSNLDSISIKDNVYVDVTYFFNQDKSLSSEDLNVTYYNDRVSYEMNARALRNDIIFEDTNFEILDVVVKDSTASVSVREVREYISSDYEGMSGDARDFEIIYSLNEDEWLLDKISANDIFEGLYLYTGCDLEKVYSIEEEAQNEDISTSSDENPQYSSNASKSNVPQDEDAFRDYALDYALNYNTKFMDYSPSNGGDGDCQNFASQCTYMGFGGEDTTNAINAHQSPMCDYGYNDDESWYCDSTSTGGNWGWTYTHYFRDYVEDYPSDSGLYGYLMDGYKYAEIGDVIHVDTDYSGTYDHAMVVVMATGTYGNRSLNKIWVCAHTGDTKNTPLSNYISRPSSSYVTVKFCDFVN